MRRVGALYLFREGEENRERLTDRIAGTGLGFRPTENQAVLNQLLIPFRIINLTGSVSMCTGLQDRRVVRR
jgi:hypothetical protein